MKFTILKPSTAASEPGFGAFYQEAQPPADPRIHPSLRADLITLHEPRRLLPGRIFTANSGKTSPKHHSEAQQSSQVPCSFAHVCFSPQFCPSFFFLRYPNHQLNPLVRSLGTDKESLYPANSFSTSGTPPQKSKTSWLGQHLMIKEPTGAEVGSPHAPNAPMHLQPSLLSPKHDPQNIKIPRALGLLRPDKREKQA